MISVFTLDREARDGGEEGVLLRQTGLDMVQVVRVDTGGSLRALGTSYRLVRSDARQASL